MAGKVTGAPPARALLRSFVWLRWRILANGLMRRRRTSWQRLGAVAELAGKIVLWAMAAGASLGLALGSLFVPWLLARAAAGDAPADGPPAEAILFFLRVVLAVFLVTLMVVPAFQGLSRGSLGRTRLLLLPIRHRTLHGLEVASHLGDPWLLMIAPALGAVAASTVVVAGAGGVVMLAAGTLFLLALAAFSATVTFAVELVLRDRRRAEALGVVLMLLWVTVAMLPGFLESRREPAPEAEDAAAEQAPAPDEPAGDRRAEEMFSRFLAFPAVLQVVPSEAYSRSVALAAAGRPGAALVPTAVLAATALGLFALSRVLWRRLLASPAGSGGRVGAGELPSPPRLPGLPAAASAVAWAQLRGFLRTLVGRMNLVIAPVVALFVGLMLRSELGEIALGGRGLGAAGTGALLAVGGAALALLSLQSLRLNQFAVDGPGFSLALLSPLERRDLVLGKWAAGAVVATALTVVTTGVVVTLEPAALPFWPAVLLAGVGASALLAPLDAWISLLLPKAVDLGRLGREAQPNQLANLLGTVATALALAVALSVGAVVLAVTRSVVAVTLAEAAFAAAALGVARLLLAPVTHALARREEAVYLALLERA